MPIRNTHKVGDYLMRDDESGLIYYASEMVKIWDGSWRNEKNYEQRHPQEFVRAMGDPYPAPHPRPARKVAVPTNSVSGKVGNTTVDSVKSAAGHLYQAGIGEMIIGSSNDNAAFRVR